MKKLFCLLGLLALTACGTAGKAPTAVKLGKPYSVEGQTYVPEQDDGYDEEGVASWYGPGFHGNLTANGETFDSHALTAAHPTLPMPSFVRVTNLKNGKAVVVRINDRGPFAKGRIIDLSHAAAKRIDMKGIARVRVQYMRAETEQYWADKGLKTGAIKFAENSPVNAPTLDEMEDVASNEAAAPILSVSESEITPASKPSKVTERMRPKFSLVSSAEAAEVPIAHSNLQQEIEDEKPQNGDLGGGGLKPLVDKPPMRVPKTEDSHGDRYFVQAGAFSHEENAHALARKISSVGEVTVSPIQGKNGMLYRVWVGPAPSREAAEATKGKLGTFGVDGARIVKE